MNINSRINYVADCIANEIAAEFKQLKNSKLGIDISVMPAKVGGCFQSHKSRVKITITDHCIGRTCSGEDHQKAADNVLSTIKQHGYLFERK